MPGVGREIKKKISSIGKTKTITKAMELVAASKMRNALKRMMQTRGYATKIRAVMKHVAKSTSEYHHPYLTPRKEIKRAGFIVVSTDRGLCGSLNINLFRYLLAEMKLLQQQGIEIELCLIGQKAENFFKRIGGNIVAEAKHLGDAPSISDLIGIVKVMLDHYDAGQIDILNIAHNQFVNTMTQKPRILDLLPITVPIEESEKTIWDYIYEPDAKELLDVLLVRYIELQVYQAVVENIACEQAARMVAMKSATENAAELIDDLSRVYNKARQAAITQEIAEIVAGAAAV